jgi:hypothetical protein
VRSATHVKLALFEARKTFLGSSFSKRVFSVDGTQLWSLDSSRKVEGVGNVHFINLTLHSSSPENFVPLVEIG